MKYTKYKLTEPMLKRLSELNNGHKHHAGNSLTALERRGLVKERPETDHLRSWYGRTHEITEEGVEALAQARREGW